MVSYEIITGIQQTTLTRPYLPLANTDHLPDLEGALNHFLGRNPIFMGDLKLDVGHLGNRWNQQVADFLASLRMLDLLGHFRQRLRFWFKQM